MTSEERHKLRRRIRWLRHFGGGVGWEEIGKRLNITARVAHQIYQTVTHQRPTVQRSKPYGPGTIFDLADDQCRYVIAPGMCCGRRVHPSQRHERWCTEHWTDVHSKDWLKELEQDVERFEAQQDPIPGLSAAISGWERKR